ncbi:membrane protein [Lentibacillus populi]|uniref:Membrane protein n=1 Tax=Lentibacillus populi TaxID=1827502 RepID=A0A9W5X6H0_9BACI|nr:MULTISPECIES: threonine/serine exporter family protein [Bacillaceae]MBT2216508.1 threonine/serine exporter ThrE family protein [Virgibacillus dakarensis]GGB51939.1 membrane protein [Lentibacillus populi]
MHEPVSISKVCILAGKIMLESGAETYRVEDTMNRIAAAYGLADAQSYATPTGINFSTDVAESTTFIRISKRSTDLHKISNVNDISRKVTAGSVDLVEALAMLKKVDHTQLTFPSWMQIVAAAFVSGSFTIMFGGTWPDYIPTFIVGGMGFAAMLGCDRLVEIRFIAEFFASLVIGLLAFGFIYSGLGVELDKIIIGAVMPLVPGLPITNAVRDLMSGHLVAGVSKGVEALLTAFAIGAGIAVVFGVL